MKQKTLQIEIPNGYEIDSIDKQSGEVKLKEKPVTALIRIKTVADVLNDHSITQEQFDTSCKGLEPDEVAYRLLKLIAKSLNEGWTPDWDDEDQYKYYPWFYLGGSSGFRFDDYGSWGARSAVGSRLCFKNNELATYAGNQFSDVYKQFMIIK